MRREVTIGEAKTQLSALIRAVEQGDEVLLRRGDTVVARLSRADAEPGPPRNIWGSTAGRWGPEADDDLEDFAAYRP